MDARDLLLELLRCRQAADAQGVSNVLDEIQLLDDIALKMRSEYLMLLHDMSTAKSVEAHEAALNALRECVDSIETVRRQFTELGIEMDFYDDFSASAMAQIIAQAKKKAEEA